MKKLKSLSLNGSELIEKLKVKLKKKMKTPKRYMKKPKEQSEVSIVERCPYKRGHYDNLTFMTPLTVLSVQ